MNQVTKSKQVMKPSGALQDNFGKCNVIAELATALTGLCFGKLLHGDPEESIGSPRYLLQEILHVYPSVKNNAIELPLWLKVVSMKVYGKKNYAPLDRSTVPNLFSSSLCQRLALRLAKTSWKVTLADETVAAVRGA